MFDFLFNIVHQGWIQHHTQYTFLKDIIQTDRTLTSNGIRYVAQLKLIFLKYGLHDLNSRISNSLTSLGDQSRNIKTHSFFNLPWPGEKHWIDWDFLSLLGQYIFCFISIIIIIIVMLVYTLISIRL